jgi:hypothetical protein
MAKKHENQQAKPAHQSYTTVMTREGVSDPSQLSSDGSLEYLKRKSGPGNMDHKKRKNGRRSQR